MIDMTYDPGADAVYVDLGRGKIDSQRKDGPFICDLDADRKVIGIEILFASKGLAPGEWRNARRPGIGRAAAAE